ncbi:hypothetical protein [Actinophytocola glycyrrhizae]|uniref:DUF5709 domain-containing protein n=1 Tax=Actinophytocola glycyrrhizae TaxID=2044873 RepID=A0ABV9RTU9_9PSEU
MSEPLDLGAGDLDEAKAREEHDLDRPEEFDRSTGVDERTETRAALLPEEEAAGSADPESQAREVLRDSEVRTEVPGAAPGTVAERRPSGP